MSILDEDESKFTISALYVYYTKVIKRCLPNARVLVINCADVICSECIGSKYNLKNGCPVCGGMYIDRIDGDPDIQTDSMINSTHRCLSCSSIIASCGGGDVSAVGVSAAELATEDDII